MPGRNAREAQQAFLEPIERTLRCLTLRHRFTMKPAHNESGRFLLALNGGVPMQLQTGTVMFDLHMAMALDLVAHEPNQVRLSTRSYIYEVHHVQGDLRRQLVRWHWHPESGRYVAPHLHLPEGVDFSRKVHVPTGRITFEDVAEFAITELEVTPALNNWQATLDEVRAKHIEHRTWSHRGPDDTGGMARPTVI